MDTLRREVLRPLADQVATTAVRGLLRGPLVTQAVDFEGSRIVAPLDVGCCDGENDLELLRRGGNRRRPMYELPHISKWPVARGSSDQARRALDLAIVKPSKLGNAVKKQLKQTARIAGWTVNTTLGLHLRVVATDLGSLLSVE